LESAKHKVDLPTLERQRLLELHKFPDTLGLHVRHEERWRRAQHRIANKCKDRPAPCLEGFSAQPHTKGIVWFEKSALHPNSNRASANLPQLAGRYRVSRAASRCFPCAIQLGLLVKARTAKRLGMSERCRRAERRSAMAPAGL